MRLLIAIGVILGIANVILLPTEGFLDAEDDALTVFDGEVLGLLLIKRASQNKIRLV